MPFRAILKSFWAVSGLFCSHSRVILNHFRAVACSLRGHFGSFLAVSGRFRACFWPFLAVLNLFWGYFRVILGCFGVVLEPLWSL